MLLPDNLHPENSIYYNGAFVLKVLQQEKDIEMLQLFNKTKELKNMSFQVYILSLDWLYLLGAAELNVKRVKLCL